LLFSRSVDSFDFAQSHFLVDVEQTCIPNTNLRRAVITGAGANVADAYIQMSTFLRSKERDDESQVPVVITMPITAEAATRVAGRHSCHLKRMEDLTGVRPEIQSQPGGHDNGDKIVTFRGPRCSVDACQKCFIAKLNETPFPPIPSLAHRNPKFVELLMNVPSSYGGL
jgi:hypothetical protein